MDKLVGSFINYSVKCATVVTSGAMVGPLILNGFINLVQGKNPFILATVYKES